MFPDLRIWGFKDLRIEKQKKRKKASSPSSVTVSQTLSHAPCKSISVLQLCDCEVVMGVTALEGRQITWLRSSLRGVFDTLRFLWLLHNKSCGVFHWLHAFNVTAAGNVHCISCEYSQFIIVLLICKYWLRTFIEMKILLVATLNNHADTHRIMLRRFYVTGFLTVHVNTSSLSGLHPHFAKAL